MRRPTFLSIKSNRLTYVMNLNDYDNDPTIIVAVIINNVMNKDVPFITKNDIYFTDKGKKILENMPGDTQIFCNIYLNENKQFCTLEQLKNLQNGSNISIPCD